MHLLPGAESAGNEEGVHRGVVAEGVVGEDREAGLRLDRSQRLGSEEGVQLGVEAPGDGEDAIGSRKVDDLRVLKM